MLDPIAPVDVAAYAGSLAWLRPDPPPASNEQATASKHAKLVIRRNGTATVLATKVRPKPLRWRSEAAPATS